MTQIHCDIFIRENAQIKYLESIIVDKYSNFKGIKTEIRDKYNIQIWEQQLFDIDTYDDEISDDTIISDFAKGYECFNIVLKKNPIEMISCIISLMDGSDFNVNINKYRKIGFLKKKICEIKSIDIQNQRMYIEVNGKIINIFNNIKLASIVNSSNELKINLIISEPIISIDNCIECKPMCMYGKPRCDNYNKYNIWDDRIRCSRCNIRKVCTNTQHKDDEAGCRVCNIMSLSDWLAFGDPSSHKTPTGETIFPEWQLILNDDYNACDNVRTDTHYHETINKIFKCSKCPKCELKSDEYKDHKLYSFSYKVDDVPCNVTFINGVINVYRKKNIVYIWRWIPNSMSHEKIYSGYTYKNDWMSDEIIQYMFD